jgi:phage/plasmid-like protein (TIGR03299 family)
MTREATWTKVGTDVSQKTSVDEILKAAHLDYTVIKEPVYLHDGILVPSRIATLKKETREPIGLVSERYEIYQNADAFKFLEEIPDIEFVRAGETYNGMVYIIGKLPSLTILNDTFTPYVIFQTSHNGWFSLRATICPLRIVCQNQFSMSFKNMENTISIRHSARIDSCIAEAQQLLKDTALYMQGFTNTAEELALLKITDNDRNKIIDAFFESTKAITDRQKAALDERKTGFNLCYKDDDNANFVGTAWGLVNALTDYETHRPRKQTDRSAETTFSQVTFDPAAMTRLLSIIRSTTNA